MKGASSNESTAQSPGQSSLSENTESHPEMKVRRSKRAGRPRLDASSNAILSAGRRTQVRRAQHTYRLKKEAIFRNATAKAEQFETRMRAAVEEIARLSEVAAESQLNNSHPNVYARLRRLNDILADRESHIEMSISAESSSDSARQRRVFDAQVQTTTPYPFPLPCRLGSTHTRSRNPVLLADYSDIASSTPIASLRNPGQIPARSTVCFGSCLA
ncbi:hypothetical protein N7532_009282 [Penicillium argentinense]|uniref:BZIP domain-containing protein n=1 Tax=Penicillium argentinense TaxID=1131581 RepID=A0A9W9K2F8_9EURO|nr:uncharacterized protein N7532_009282 [Penicillium argentinense]KAJ5090598.1 hypothetical protein N7532_009282 [Penicillium argentinense]